MSIPPSPVAPTVQAAGDEPDFDNVPISDHEQAALYEFTRGTPHHNAVRTLYQKAYLQVNSDEPELIRALAECRDAFPVPAPGSPEEQWWSPAIGDPLSVPAFVRAMLAARPTVEAPAAELPEADIKAINDMANEYESLALRWREARPYSQDVANLHATYKAREHTLGKLAEGGLFRRVADMLSACASCPQAAQQLSSVHQAASPCEKDFHADRALSACAPSAGVSVK